MTSNYLNFRIADLNSARENLELELADFPIKGSQSAKVADNMKIAIGHLNRANEYLGKAKVELR